MSRLSYVRPYYNDKFARIGMIIDSCDPQWLFNRLETMDLRVPDFHTIFYFRAEEF